MVVFDNVKHHVKVFTFLKILGNGKIRRGGSDGTGKDSWFILKKVFFQNGNNLIEYCINHETDKIDIYENEQVIGFFHRNDVVDKTELVLNALETSHNPFLIPSVREFLDEIGYMKVIENGTDDSSLSLVMYDPQTDMNLKFNYRILSDFLPVSGND